MSSNNEQILLENYIDQCVKKFIDFMGIPKMPKFQIVPISISLEKANQRGYGAFAAQFYDVNTGTNELRVWTDLYKPQLHAEYLLFHEFTHILDTKMYSQKDKQKNVSIKGYAEYHAAQIDFLKVLGVENIQTFTSFSMNQEIETITGKESALEYVLDAHKTATALISRPDFPADMATLATTLGLIFNYLGRLSICKMYAEDYKSYAVLLNDTEIEKQFFGKDVYEAMCAFLSGWILEPQIKILGDAYLKIVVDKAQGLS